VIRGTRPRRAAANTLAVGAVGAILAGGLLLVDSAYGAFIDVPPTGAPGRLVLASDPFPAQFLSLSPGDPAHWLIDARLEDAETAELSLEFRKSGDLVEHPRGLRMGIEICDVPWSPAPAPACTGTSQTLIVAGPVDDNSASSPVFQLEPLAAGSPRHLLVTLAVEPSAAAAADESLMGLQGEMAIGLTAVTIDDVPPPPDDGALPQTGAPLGSMIAAAAIGLGTVALGIALRLRRKGAAR
jgi:hypothetical protein